MQYHLDFDHESLLMILKYRKLKTKATGVINCNHDNFCTNYIFEKKKYAEDFNFVYYWVRPSIKVEFQNFQSHQLVVYPTHQLYNNHNSTGITHLNK